VIAPRDNMHDSGSNAGVLAHSQTWGKNIKRCRIIPWTQGGNAIRCYFV